MSNKHREIRFEGDIVGHLTAHGWLLGDWKNYDRELALYPEDLIGWLKETQPKEWEKLQANADAERGLLTRVAKLLDRDGSLTLLRHGFKDLNARFQLCQFKPSQGLNPETLERYNKVRCRVVRQVRYSLNNENSIDLVFFVNGVPIATLEVKTDFTQSVHDAIRQYKYDRKPKDPLTKKEEPLLAFKRRALVHFAVSSDEVCMTTELKGAATEFLPFNMGNNEGAGNPVNPEGYRTSYLWERVLERASWLNILGRFVHLEKKEKKQPDGSRIVKESMIFPRYHQWEVVNKLIETARTEKAGHKYLIQHSAGSGKSNSIAWLAHQLASLHDENDRKVFDTVIVITDRTVLDDQLQETIYQFEHKEGVVCRIKREGVKSEQLVKALVDRMPIIIVTIQTFPFVLDAIREVATLKDRTFAVIADEAHSSQTGAAARTLREVLTAEQIEEGEEVSAEDLMVAAMDARTQPENISFFAFTATPKAKTVEMFGRKGESGLPEAFHVYSMQQAIEEGFILDVLKNYTSYRLAFKLAHGGKEYDDEQVDKAEGLKQLARWVRLHPYNISQKVAIIVEHFRSSVAPLLDGHAKAMVVTGSRKEAVRYKLAIDKYIRDEGYENIKTLVAFSGEISDPESGPDKFSEANMNPDLRGRDLREAFDTDEYRILLVANKFQTGFDQPLLVAMYVDKKLDDVAAVQTLSRLNRTYPGKTDTFVLDFVNTSDRILKAFLPYYKTARLSGVSDPNIIHDLQTKLDSARIYTPTEVDAFALAYFDPKGGQRQLQAQVAPAVERYRKRRKAALQEGDRQELDALEVFRKDLASFIRAYDFLSQIINYGDTDLEKRSAFYRHLLPWLKTENLSEPIDLSSVELTHYRLQDLGKRRIRLDDKAEEEGKLKPMTDVGTAVPRDRQQASLSEIVAQMNSLFEGELTDADLINYAHHVRDKMLESEVLAQQAATNSKEQFALGDFHDVMMDAVIEGLDNYQSMADQVLNNEQVQKGFAALLLDLVYQAFQKQSDPKQDAAT
ncbi:MAG TPA: DEAD/DEAH box helicase family protein [Pyrinomonadaceae bacterium]|nr:DEAD/DEAH box helicase family protein [Pyrinomonadaceae bacterium]